MARRPRTSTFLALAVVAVALAVAVVLFRAGLGAAPSLMGFNPSAIERRVADALPPIVLQPSRTLRVTVRDATWLDDSGRPFLETPRATAMVELSATGSSVVVSHGVIVEPRLQLVQVGAERWNYEVPLAPFLGDGEGDREEGGLAVWLDDMAARGANITIRMLEATYEVRSLDVSLAGGQLSGPGLVGPTFRVSQAAGELILPDTAAESGTVARSVRLSDGEFQLVDGELSMGIDRARFGGSRLTGLEGIWDPRLGGYGLDMRLRVAEGRVADLPWLRGDVPAGAGGTLDVRLEPRPADRTLLTLSDLDLSGGGSSGSGSVRMVIGGKGRPTLEAIDVRLDPLSLGLAEAFTGPLPFGGTLTGTVRGASDDIAVDVTGRLTASTVDDPIRVGLTGRFALSDEGARVRSARVSLDRVPLEALGAVAPSSPLRGPVSGTVDLDSAPGEGPLGLDLRLEAGGGIVTLTGTVEPSGAEPAYDVAGRIAGVNLRSVLEPATPPLEMNARFDLEGRGVDPATAVATVSADGTFTGWQSGPGDTLVVRAGLRGGTLDARTVHVRVGPLSVDAGGRWAFSDGSGGLEFRAVAADLEPLAPYLPTDPDGRRRFAHGSVETSGTLAGTLASPTLSGDLGARSFRWGEWAAESLSGSYALARRNGVARIRADLTGQDLRTPATDFDEIDGILVVGRPDFDFAFRADQEGGGRVEVEADGRVDANGRRDIHVRTMELELDRHTWRLPRPAAVTWTADNAIDVSGLVLEQTDGSGRVALEGALAPADRMDATLDIVRLPVGDVLALAGVDVPLEGTLDANASVSGPADSPSMQMHFTLADGAFRDVRIRNLDTDIQYDATARTLTVVGQGSLGDSASIEINGTVPASVRLSGSPLFALVDDDPIDLRIVSRTFPLSTVDPGLSMVENVEGRLEANLRVSGTPATPQLSGAAQLLDGAMTVPMLNRRFHGIRGRVLLTGRQANLERLVIESGGRAVVAGSLDFEDLTNPALSLDIDLQQLRLQGLDGDEASIDGSLSLGGNLTQPVLTGDIRADNGALSLIPLQQAELSTRLTDSRSSLAADFDFDEPERERGIAVRDLQFTAGRNLRFVSREAQVPLAGTLSLDRSGQSLAIQGTLAGEGGSFELRAGVITRQFQIVSAEIRFFGSPHPNPRLDIVASRQVRTADGGTVDIEVRVGGNLETPTLSLATATGPAIPESDLLSFLLFGRNTSDLGQVAGGGGTEGLVGQSVAYTGLTEALASQINEAVGVLDYFQLNYLPSGGIFATAGVELLNDWFLNAEWASAQADLSSVGLEHRANVGLFRFAWEPVRGLDRLLGARTRSFIEAEVRRQLFFAWRRRWTY